MGAVTRYSFWALGHYIEFIVFGYWAQHTANMEDLINCIFIFSGKDFATIDLSNLFLFCCQYIIFSVTDIQIEFLEAYMSCH